MVYAIGLIVTACLGVYGVLLGLGHVDRPAFLSARRLTLILGAMLILSSTDIGLTWAYYRTDTPQRAVLKASAGTVTASLATLMRFKSDLPIRINDNLTLRDFSSDGRFIVYKISIYGPGSDDSQNFLSIVNGIRDDIMKNACNRDDYRSLLKFGLGIEIDLYGRWGVDPIQVTPEYCGF